MIIITGIVTVLVTLTPEILNGIITSSPHSSLLTHSQNLTEERRETRAETDAAVSGCVPYGVRVSSPGRELGFTRAEMSLDVTPGAGHPTSWHRVTSCNARHYTDLCSKCHKWGCYMVRWLWISEENKNSSVQLERCSSCNDDNYPPAAYGLFTFLTIASSWMLTNNNQDVETRNMKTWAVNSILSWHMASSARLPVVGVAQQFISLTFRERCSLQVSPGSRNTGVSVETSPHFTNGKGLKKIT